MIGGGDILCDSDSLVTIVEGKIFSSTSGENGVLEQPHTFCYGLNIKELSELLEVEQDYVKQYLTKLGFINGTELTKLGQAFQSSFGGWRYSVFTMLDAEIR